MAVAAGDVALPLPGCGFARADGFEVDVGDPHFSSAFTLSHRELATRDATVEDRVAHFREVSQVKTG